jgi:hypothetical protein
MGVTMNGLVLVCLGVIVVTVFAVVMVARKRSKSRAQR